MKYKFACAILLSAFLCAYKSWAQTESTSLSHQTLEDSIAHTSTWQLTLDVIKAKAQATFNKNAQLLQENQSLTDEYKTQQGNNQALQQKIQDLKKQIKDRHGRSDDEMKVVELEQQIKDKKNQLNDRKKDLDRFADEAKAVQHKIELIKLKDAAQALEHKEQSLTSSEKDQAKKMQASQDDTELTDLKQKYQKEQEQEAFLEKQINDARQTQMLSSNLTQSDEQKLDELQKKADLLAKQKEDLQKQLNSDNNRANKLKYEQLMMRKGELEQKIKESEVQLNQLRHSSSITLSDNKSNKALLKQMIQVDARNKQLLRKIAQLNEDVLVLRTQIKRLERKVYQRAKIQDHKK